MNSIREWLTTVIPTINLLVILFGMVRIWSRSEEERKVKEVRLVQLENKIARLEDLKSFAAEIRATVREMSSEIQRMRDRLDRFLDIKASGD